ncbi:hypothetical protein F2Q69_00001286 [Brassica cretica]|uniref:Uncharacterized protein n=1 Tax=Brassica cretica TaxID=69181 RepID=A0A8S9P7B3_BRACR|nr:hypothetical protein F2Q69_00001286 [Brassica cretica]
MSTMASSVSVFGPASARLISYKRGPTRVRCDKEEDRKETRTKAELGTIYTKSRKEKQKSEGGFVDDVYKKYIQSKLETNETVVNEVSDGGGKREAGEKGSGGADLNKKPHIIPQFIQRNG